MSLLATIIKGVVLIGGGLFVAKKLQKAQPRPRKSKDNGKGNGDLPDITDLPKPTKDPPPPPNFIKITDAAKYKQYAEEYLAPALVGEGKPIPPLVAIALSDETFTNMVINAARGDPNVIYLLSPMTTVLEVSPNSVPLGTWAAIASTNKSGQAQEPTFLPAGSKGVDLLAAMVAASTYAKATP